MAAKAIYTAFSQVSLNNILIGLSIAATVLHAY